MTESINVKNEEFKEFFTNLSRVLEKAPSGIIKDYHFLFLPANELPWRETDIDIEKGEQITIISHGKVYIMKQFNFFLEPFLQLWFRIGSNGEIFNGPRNTFTFTGDEQGKLYIGNYLQDWADNKGKTNSKDERTYKVYKPEGGISILVIKWNGDPLEGLNRVLSNGDHKNLLEAELDALKNPIHHPKGWKYLWSIGESDAFWECSDSLREKKICCQVAGQGAILQKEAKIDLNPKTKIQWSWKIDKLPSDKAENNFFFHDYLSVAVEFDDGQDITYHWSPELPIETSYRCPFPTWNKRETHLVVRTGREGLGEWFNEERNLYEDYKKAIGEPPQKIIRVWLIASTFVQKKEGKIEYADIKIKDAKTIIKIL